jgi:ATP-dependent HslUV protease ATP-binding subunit HslU
MNKEILNSLKLLTPKSILELLDTHVIGQEDAKKAVALALRNRYRRMMLPDDLKEEVSPKNILLIGSTGVGKTEIARRLAKIIKAPFIKTEATRFTEVGYVGKDVENMVRDLVNVSFNLIKKEYEAKFKETINSMVNDRLLEILLPEAKQKAHSDPSAQDALTTMQKKLLAKKLEDKEITLALKKPSSQNMGGPILGVLSNMGMEDLENQMGGMFDQFSPNNKSKERTLTIKEARPLLFEEESAKVIDIEKIKTEAVERTENLGIIFLDEIDKIAAGSQRTADVSREGVQRDLLPIIEGTTVNTRYGAVKTDYILFIGAGAFHFSKPSDLIPELQGRFPIRVQLNPLKKEELRRILTEPKNSLTEQYKKLLETEDVKIEFSDEAIDYIAEYSMQVNDKIENIGARRLHTVLEKILEEVSFNAPEIKGQTINITETYVKERLKEISLEQDLSHYIL